MASISETVLRKFAALKTQKVCKDGNKKPLKPLDSLENFLCEIHRIVVWEDVDYTMNCFLFVTTVFCLLNYMEFRVFGVIFFFMFCFSLEELLTNHAIKLAKKKGWENESGRVQAKKSGSRRNADFIDYMKKSESAIRNACARLKSFRRTEPGKFCAATCLCLLWLQLIGQNVTDYRTLYLVLMFVIAIPGFIHHYIPPKYVRIIVEIISSSPKGDAENDDDEVDPYLPEDTPENQELLNLAGDLVGKDNEEDEESNDLLLDRMSARTTDTTESVSSKMSFYPESSLMPSPETSIDFLELDLPSGGKKSESNGNDYNGINFQSQHFDGDTSDEEDEFVKGLAMNENEKKKTEKKVKQQSDNVGPSMLSPGNLMTVGTALLNAIKNSKKPPKNDKESSDDTDSFEIISDEEM